MSFLALDSNAVVVDAIVLAIDATAVDVTAVGNDDDNAKAKQINDKLW